MQTLLARAADFGIASLPIEHPGLDVHWIGEAPCVAAVAAGSELATQDTIRIADLAGACIITMANPYRLRRRVNEASRRPASRRCASSTPMLRSPHCRSPARGWALPSSSRRAPAGSCRGLVLKPLDVHIPFLFGTVSPAAKPLSSTLIAFNDALREVAARRLPGFRLHEAGKREALADAVYGADAPAPTAAKGRPIR